MTDYTKPISSSNPPESKGDRRPKTETPMVPEATDGKNEKLVYEPTVVEPSPKKPATKTISKKAGSEVSTR